MAVSVCFNLQQIKSLSIMKSVHPYRIPKKSFLPYVANETVRYTCSFLSTSHFLRLSSSQVAQLSVLI